MLDKFFLKYEGGGVKGQIDPPPGRTTLKKPSLIRVKGSNTSTSMTLLKN